MSKFCRPLIIGSLTSFLVNACISAQDITPAGVAGNTSSSASGSTGGGNSQGGAIAGHTGGSRVTAGATGGAILGNTGGSAIVGNGGAPAGATGGVAAGATGGAVAGATGGQGANSTGGIAAQGGAPSTGAPPSSGLGVYIDTQNNGGAITGDNSLHLRVEIVNTSSSSQDLTAVTLRYWYMDDGWGSTQLVKEDDYVRIGNAGVGTVTYGGSYAATPAQPGADHYFEFSFTGTLTAATPAGVNDINSNAIFHVQVRLHASNYQGTADVSNDYSVMTSTGYDDRITLYSAGTLIWGTEPGGTSASGSGGASSVGGSSGATGGTAASNTASTGGTATTGGATSSGGVTSMGGNTSATGGDTGTGGDTSMGGDTSLGGDTSVGGSSDADAG